MDDRLPPVYCLDCGYITFPGWVNGIYEEVLTGCMCVEYCNDCGNIAVSGWIGDNFQEADCRCGDIIG